MLDLVLWLLVPLIAFALLILLGFVFAQPLIKSFAAGQKFLWAKLKENNALGLQTNDLLTDMVIYLKHEQYDLFMKLYEGHPPYLKANPDSWLDLSYEEFIEDPELYLGPEYRHAGNDGIVYVGLPFFGLRSVREWFFTPQHRLALPKGRHSIPMTIQTLTLGMIDPEEKDSEGKLMRDKLERRLAEVFDDSSKQLNPSEEWMLLVLDVAETEDGFSVPVKMEIDILIGDPKMLMASQSRDNIGVQLLSHVNAAVRQSMKGLLALRVTDNTSDATEAKNALQESLEKEIWRHLGFREDGSTDGNWYTRIMSNEHHPLTLLARYGLLVVRARVADIRLPEALKRELQKSTMARASMNVKLLDAESRKRVAAQDKETKKLAGEGEEAFAKAVARGDRSRIEAWSGDGKEVDEAAVAARLVSQQLETYAAAVKDSKSPVIVGAPGQQFDGASALAGGLSQIGIGLGAKPKSNSEKDKDKRGKKGKAPDEESTGDAETSTEE